LPYPRSPPPETPKTNHSAVLAPSPEEEEPPTPNPPVNSHPEDVSSPNKAKTPPEDVSTLDKVKTPPEDVSSLDKVKKLPVGKMKKLFLDLTSLLNKDKESTSAVFLTVFSPAALLLLPEEQLSVLKN
jgi:hypothetical protein